MNNQDWNSHVRRIMLENKIHTVRVCLQDNSNIQRSRFVSARNFLDKVIFNGIACPSILFSLDSSAKVVIEAGEGYESGYPSWTIRPDLSTFGLVPYSSGTARVISDIYGISGLPVKHSPRQVLKNVLQQYETAGIKVKGAFEYEFFVFKNKQDGSGFEPSWSGLNLLSEINQNGLEEIISEVMLNLAAIGANPEVANTEYAPGQFEITNSPFWGIEIADMAYYYRTTIKEIISNLGHKATFMAKPITNQSGSGAHIHLSIYDSNNENLMYDSAAQYSISDICRYFIGGQLKHGRALCALVNSSINSYKRLQPYTFAPTNLSWGFEHRGTMIRIPSSREQNTHIENRLPGADTNPYISLSAILAAGMDGIRNRIEPPDPLINIDAYKSQSPSLPKSLEEALIALESDEFFRSELGNEFIDNYIKLRRSEIERYNMHVSDWEYKEYMDLI
jgi:glutamine synthetase